MEKLEESFNTKKKIELKSQYLNKEIKNNTEYKPKPPIKQNVIMQTTLKNRKR